MSVKVTIEKTTNKKATDMLKKLIKGQSGVKVGFYEGNPNIHKAIANEFGVPEQNVPPRPFMHQTVQNHKKEWSSLLAKLLKKNGNDLDDAFNSLGAAIKGQVVDTIINGDFERNAPSTIAKKGFDKPLIDTSDMKNSVNWAIIKGTK